MVGEPKETMSDKPTKSTLEEVETPQDTPEQNEQERSKYETLRKVGDKTDVLKRSMPRLTDTLRSINYTLLERHRTEMMEMNEEGDERINELLESLEALSKQMEATRDAFVKVNVAVQERRGISSAKDTIEKVG